MPSRSIGRWRDGFATIPGAVGVKVTLTRSRSGMLDEGRPSTLSHPPARGTQRQRHPVEVAVHPEWDLRSAPV